MIYLVDLSQPDLFNGHLFTRLQGTFYILVEGPASPARVEQIKSAFPDLSLGTVKVVFVKSFSPSIIQKFAFDKCEHPDRVVDLRPTEWMAHTHLFPPSVSREVIRSTPYNYELRDVLLRMILDCMCAILGGIRICPDTFPVLAHIQSKFVEHLELGDDFVEDFDPFKHSVYCKPREHIWARMDPSGEFRWPMPAARIETMRTVLDRISFQELLHLADSEELIEVAYPAAASSQAIPNDEDVFPVGIRKFVCTRTNAKQAFMCLSNEACPEFDWVESVTAGFFEPTPIDLLIETRTDPRAQVGVLVECFKQIAPGGIVYFKRPDVTLTVILSTWNTPVPLGSLHGNLAHVFENFSHFHVDTNGSLWIQKRTED